MKTANHKPKELKRLGLLPFFDRLDLKKPIGLLFDVDELLFDNCQDIRSAYQKLVESYHVTVNAQEEFCGKHLFEILENLKDKYHLSASIDEMMQRRRTIYLDILRSSQTTPCEGVKEIFRFLDRYRNDSNIRIGFVTSSEEAIVEITFQKIFATIGMPQYVDKPFTFFYHQNGTLSSTYWERGLQKKPSPQLYELTLKKMGIEARQGIAFEDSVSGSQAALALDLNLVVIPSFKDRDSLSRSANNQVYWADSLLDFLPFLEELFKEIKKF